MFKFHMNSSHIQFVIYVYEVRINSILTDLSWHTYFIFFFYTLVTLEKTIQNKVYEPYLFYLKKLYLNLVFIQEKTIHKYAKCQNYLPMVNIHEQKETQIKYFI